MSEAYLNQVTIDCLLNKQLIKKHLKNQSVNQINKEDRKFYRKRIHNLFKELLTGNEPDNLLLDVKYAYENLVNSTIQYFKIIDQNDIVQSEYNDINKEIPILQCSNEIDLSANLIKKTEMDLLLMRRIKIEEVNTLDKYVKRRSTKKVEQIILPKQKDINLYNPELKTKGIKNKDN